MISSSYTYGATLLARVLEGDTRGPELIGARQGQQEASADHSPQPSEVSTFEAGPPINNVRGQILIVKDRVHLSTRYGNIKLKDDAAQEVKWIAELIGAGRETKEQRSEDEQPTALLWEKAMERESGACAWVLMDPRRVEHVCATLATGLAQVKPGLSCDVVIAPTHGGVIIGHELARQLGVPAMFLVKDGEKFALRHGVELDKGSSAVADAVELALWQDLELEEGSQVVLANDAVNNGDTMRACIKYVEDVRKGNVVAAACLVDRRKVEGIVGKIGGVPLVAFWTRFSQPLAGARDADVGAV